MSEQIIVTIFCAVIGYHQCPFTVKEGEVFSVSKKKGERGNALKVCSGRGQLGHLQLELVSTRRPLEVKIIYYLIVLE